MADSILQRTRREGYNEGWATASGLAQDDAYERGREAGLTEAAVSHRWLLLGGAVMGAGFVAAVWAVLA